MSQLSHKLPWELAQDKWSSVLNPVLANPIISGSLLQNIKLVSGANTINHGLGQKLQGYIVVMNSSPATFYDFQATNSHSDLTLILNASQSTVVTLYVF